MTRITKKAFIAAVAENTTTFEVCTRWSRGITAEKVRAALESLETLKGKRRRVTVQRSSYLEFTGGSRLYLDQGGKNEYYAHRTRSGLQFYIAANTIFDEWEGVNKTQWIIYGVAIAEADEEKTVRTWNSFDISDRQRAEDFRRILLQNGYKFETGAAENFKHFSVFCSESEADMLLNIA